MHELALRALNTFLDPTDYHSDQAIEDAVDDLLKTSKFATLKSEREILLSRHGHIFVVTMMTIFIF